LQGEAYEDEPAPEDLAGDGDVEARLADTSPKMALLCHALFNVEQNGADVDVQHAGAPVDMPHDGADDDMAQEAAVNHMDDEGPALQMDLADAPIGVFVCLALSAVCPHYAPCLRPSPGIPLRCSAAQTLLWLCGTS
jgi:hypothetical protein